MPNPKTRNRVSAFVHNVKHKILGLTISIKEKSGYISWGEKNDSPNVLAEWVSRSRTAGSCVERLAQFIEADGFQDAKVGETIIDFETKATADDLLMDCSVPSAQYNGVALRVFFKGDGTYGRIEALDWKHLRRNKEEQWVYNKNFGKKEHKKKEDRILDEFKSSWTPEERIVEIKKQLAYNLDNYGEEEQSGFILYDFIKSQVDGGDIYPIPRAMTVLEDIQSDALLSELDLSNIQDGWSGTIVIETPPLDDEIPDEETKQTEKQAFQSHIKNNLTGTKGSKVVHLESMLSDDGTVETRPRVYALTNQAGIDATDKAIPRKAANVCQLYNVPKFLVGLGENGKLGNSNEIINELKVFNLTINPRQRMITRLFSQLFPEGKDWTISTLNLIDYMPTELLSKLSKEELAAIYGITIPEIENSGSNGTGTEK